MALYGDYERVWNMTPRQGLAYLTLADHRMKEQEARLMGAIFNAAQGSAKDVNREIKRLMRGFEPPR